MKVFSSKVFRDKYIGKGFFNCVSLEIKDMSYLSGVTDVDRILKESGISASSGLFKPKTTLYGCTNGLGIDYSVTLNSELICAAILSENLNYWSIEPYKEILRNRSKSVVGRALVGAVIFGPVGAIIGGMTAIRKDEENLARSVVVFSSKTQDKEDHSLAFDVSNDDYVKLEKFLIQLWPDKKRKYNFADEERFEEESNIDRLIKLKELLDCGAIKEEDFVRLKQKLI
jgi:hypothetical protein